MLLQELQTIFEMRGSDKFKTDADACQKRGDSTGYHKNMERAYEQDAAIARLNKERVKEKKLIAKADEHREAWKSGSKVMEAITEASSEEIRKLFKPLEIEPKGTIAPGATVAFIKQALREIGRAHV
jgi:TPP-dependent indolepyruvate ferredoxin oxidoreductase alpha subunit